MNKSEFIEFLATLNSTTKSEAERVINTFTSGVVEAFKNKKDITLVGFGTFTSKKINARDGVNPKTGEKMKFKAYIRPSFKPGKGIKDACN